MSSAISSAWRSFWHTMTSNDRHAFPESQYRSSDGHLSLTTKRHTQLTSVMTDSTVDLGNSYEEPDSANVFTPTSAKLFSPTAPYSPGLRSAVARQRSDEGTSGEIQMSSFRDGLPPPPPPSHTWKRIDRWTEDNYEELYENLCEGCTQNDVNELEMQLDCSLPMDVRESLMIHDGQERGGQPTGILFGCMLLDCEEIVQEWTNWRIVDREYLTKSPAGPSFPQSTNKAFGGGPSTSSSSSEQQQQSSSKWRHDLLAKQDSQPSNAVQKQYSHPAWIPLARDWGGNNICVDLAPGPAGQWGQVILAGRDYDCKYVVGRSWASFLATVADDMSTDKWYIEEESKELKLREFRNAEPSYIDILRWRCDQKHGRKQPPGKRKANGLHINSNVSEARANGASSPYGSPLIADMERSGSPQRLQYPGRAGASSPARARMPSPLTRVAGTVPGRLQLDMSKSKQASHMGNLLSLDSPRISTENLAKPSDATPGSEAPSEPDRKNEVEAGQPEAKSESAASSAQGGMTTVDI